jgi:hypothetical protein
MKQIVFSDLSDLRKTSLIRNFDQEYIQFKEKINKFLSENSDITPLFISITGSSSYGLELEESDLDGKGVYIQDINSILSELKIGQANPLMYKPQINGNIKNSKIKTKEDITLYELGRYLELVQDNNPNIVEMLSTPENCIVYKHPLWDEIVDKLKSSDVLTKKCYHTFFSYASQQIKKATGLNKKINNPIPQERKTPVDFCYVIFENDSAMNLRSFLEKNRLDQRMCGLVNVPHARDLYGLYYDYESAKSFSKYENNITREEYRLNKLSKDEIMGFGYKGIIKENDLNEEVSFDIRVSPIPIGEERIAQISYNKDGYMKYCKDYTAMWSENGWMNMRNEERYNDNIKSNQNYDGKNLSHCLRLLYMAKEIAEGKGVIVQRTSEQRKELFEVKKGSWSYEDIMSKCEELTNGLDEAYKNSQLPDDISYETIQSILLEFKRKFYFNS